MAVACPRAPSDARYDPRRAQPGNRLPIAGLQPADRIQPAVDAMLATRVSFINERANLAQATPNECHFAIWAQAFRPNTEGMREAPGRTLLNELFAAGATATARGPVAMEAARRVFRDEASPIYVTHPQTVLETLGARAGLRNEFHILSPLFT